MRKAIAPAKEIANTANPEYKTLPLNCRTRSIPAIKYTPFPMPLMNTPIMSIKKFRSKTNGCNFFIHSPPYIWKCYISIHMPLAHLHYFLLLINVHTYRKDLIILPLIDPPMLTINKHLTSLHLLILLVFFHQDSRNKSPWIDITFQRCLFPFSHFQFLKCHASPTVGYGNRRFRGFSLAHLIVP